MGQLLSCRVPRLYIDRPNRQRNLTPGNKILLNWGNSGPPVDVGGVPISKWVNNHKQVSLASNKLRTFQELEKVDGIRIPEFTPSGPTAREWLVAGVAVVCRTKLTGHSGDGIVLANGKEASLPAAPLYVKYIKKQKEFRIHVAFGEVIDVQEKRKRKDLADNFETNYQVRNHHTGWVYCREDIQEPEEMRGMAIATVRALGLDFGAVDVIWNEKANQCFVLEVNTAPGLEGTTVEKYAEAFVKELRK